MTGFVEVLIVWFGWQYTCWFTNWFRLLELARNASRLYAKQPVHEKKRFLNLVLSNCQWDQGEVRPVFRQPFDLLAETVVAGAAMGAQQAALSTGSPVWLGFPGSFSNFLSCDCR